MYQLLRKLLFLFDAEKVHYFTMNSLKVIYKIPFSKPILKSVFTPKDFPVNVFGIPFKNPVGLAAGFDKNAKYLSELENLGFGFIEVGTVTPLPQAGNEKPRLFRLQKDKAIINRMGFNNDGAEMIAKRILKFKSRKSNLIIGGNIGKNKNTPNESAWQDYEKCFIALFDVVDYFVVNVSSPNTPGLRDLQQKDSLKNIFDHLQVLNNQKEKSKPILLKIAPDLNEEDLNDIIDLAIEIKLDGLVVTNTTISRGNCVTSKNTIEQLGAGGLSGQPLLQRSNEVLKKISDRTNGRIPLIGSGGVMNAANAIEKKHSGASLLQVYTGFIYEGPGIVKKIVNALRRQKY